MRAPFVNKDGLYFKIYRKGFFSLIGKFFGLHDIEIGDPYLDDTFVIRGNDAEKIRLLLNDDRLKDMILHAQPDIFFSDKGLRGMFRNSFSRRSR